MGHFDVMSAMFVFEAAANPNDLSSWKEYLESSTEALAPGGHLVFTTALSENGKVWEAGIWKDTVSVSADHIKATLAELGFVDVKMDLIPGTQGFGYEAVAAVTAKKAGSPAGSAGSAVAATPNRMASTSIAGGGDGDNAAVARFMKKHFRHFNSAALVDAAEG